MKWTLRGLIVTPILALPAIVIGGGGHGYIGPMLVCFPIAFALEIEHEALIWISILFQFPVYGFIVDLTIRKPPIAAIVITGLALLHVAMISKGFYNVR